MICEAVKQFYEKHQCLPVAGGLPDMKAQSAVYIQLQNIYRAKARKDAAEVLATVRSMAGGETVDQAEVEQFCTNARFIKLINSADLAEITLDQVIGTYSGVAELLVTGQPSLLMEARVFPLAHTPQIIILLSCSFIMAKTKTERCKLIF
jgi:hypothetical protein